MAQEYRDFRDTVSGLAKVILVLGAIFGLCYVVLNTNLLRSERPTKAAPKPTTTWYPAPSVPEQPTASAPLVGPVISAVTCRDSAKKMTRGEVYQRVMKPDGTVERRMPRTGKRLTEEDVRSFQGVVREYQYILEAMRSPVRPIDNAVLRARLDAAQRMILSADPPPCAWKWEQVRELVKKYGGHLVADGYGRINPFASDKTGHGQWPSIAVITSLASMNVLLEEDTPSLALKMVQTATNIVFEDLLMKESGFNNAEMFFAHTLCSDFQMTKTFLYTVIIRWNILRYADSAPIEHGASALGEGELEALRAFDAKENHALLLSSFVNAAMLHRELQKEGLMELIAEGWSCKLPPITRGPNRGLEFYPSDVDDPLINLVEREMLELGNADLDEKEELGAFLGILNAP